MAKSDTFEISLSEVVKATERKSRKGGSKVEEQIDNALATFAANPGEFKYVVITAIKAGAQAKNLAPQYNSKIKSLEDERETELNVTAIYLEDKDVSVMVPRDVLEAAQNAE